MICTATFSGKWHRKTNQLLISIFSQYHLKDSPGEEITGQEEEKKQESRERK